MASFQTCEESAYWRVTCAQEIRPIFGFFLCVGGNRNVHFAGPVVLTSKCYSREGRVMTESRSDFDACRAELGPDPENLCGLRARQWEVQGRGRLVGRYQWCYSPTCRCGFCEQNQQTVLAAKARAVQPRFKAKPSASFIQSEHTLQSDTKANENCSGIATEVKVRAAKGP